MEKLNQNLFKGASATIKTLALIIIKVIEIGLFIYFLPFIAIYYILKSIFGSN